MGYTTDFTGKFNLDKPLTPEHKAYLEAFAQTRRMNRKASETEKLPDPIRIAAGLPIGEQGGYFVGAANYNGDDPFASHGQQHTDDIADYNQEPTGQPGLWCQWTPSEDGSAIAWDGGEKFYCYVEWIEYLIRHFLSPWGYTLNGTVEYQGEDSSDKGRIVIVNNGVKNTNRSRNYR